MEQRADIHKPDMKDPAGGAFKGRVQRNREKKRMGKQIREQIRKGKAVPLLFLAPSFAGVFIFVLFPFLDVIRRSFYSAMGGEFRGFRNYANVLENEAFRLAAGNTLKFAVVCIPLLVVLSLILAVVLNTMKNNKEMWKSTFLLPMAVPAASIVLMWKIFFHDNGIVNRFFESLGWGSVTFMGSGLAFWVLVGSYLWKNMGYDMILWMAGLSNIPGDLYEAASLDGAGSIRQFFFITLPNLVTVLFTIFVLSLLNSFKVFREAYLVAGDYPHTSMYMLQHLFNNWFTALDIEKLCAGAVMMAMVIFALILLLQKAWGEET